MKFIEYRELVKSLRQGKQLPTVIYLEREHKVSLGLQTLLQQYRVDHNFN